MNQNKHLHWIVTSGRKIDPEKKKDKIVKKKKNFTFSGNTGQIIGLNSIVPQV